MPGSQSSSGSFIQILTFAMANTEQLTANYVRAGIRSALAKTQLSKAKAELKSKSQEESSALSRLARLREIGARSSRAKNEASEDYVAAAKAVENASESLAVQQKAANRFNGCHTEAYERLLAAQKDPGPRPASPLQYVFEDEVPTIASTLKRSASKRYKFETAFDSWRRDVDEAFADYARIETFPTPPGKCKAQFCQHQKSGGTCRNNIEQAFGRVENLRAELKRWSPDGFAVCAADMRKEFQEQAREICAVIREMIAQQDGSGVVENIQARSAPKPSRWVFW